MRPLLLAIAAYATFLGESALAAPAAQQATDQDGQRLLAELRTLAADLEYDRVVAVGRRVLLRGDLSEDQRIEALVLLGSALVIIADPSAPDVLDEILRLRPSYELPAGTERKVTVAFADAKARQRRAEEAQRIAAVRAMVIESPDIAKAAAGEPLVFEFAIRDPNRVVNSAALKYRLATSPDFLALTLRPPNDGSDRWSGQIPGTVTAGKGGVDLQWFLTTSDAAGQPLIGVADAAAPRLVHIDKAPAPAGDPFYKKWWFWTAVGVGAAAATTAVILATNSGDDGNVPQGDLPTVELR